MFVIVGSHVLDLSGVNSIEQAEGIARSELAGLPDDMPIAFVAVPGARGL